MALDRGCVRCTCSGWERGNVLLAIINKLIGEVIEVTGVGLDNDGDLGGF